MRRAARTRGPCGGRGPERPKGALAPSGYGLDPFGTDPLGTLSVGYRRLGYLLFGVSARIVRGACDRPLLGPWLGLGVKGLFCAVTSRRAPPSLGGSGAIVAGRAAVLLWGLCRGSRLPFLRGTARTDLRRVCDPSGGGQTLPTSWKGMSDSGLGSPSWDPLGPNRFTPSVRFWPGGEVRCLTPPPIEHVFWP